MTGANNQDTEMPVPKSAQGPKTKDFKLVFTRKENATLAQCIEILKWFHEKSRNQSKNVHHFDSIYPNLKLKQPIISDWVKNEVK